MKTLVACRHCGAKFKTLTDHIPDYGRPTHCPLCGHSITLWKPDEYYLEQYAKEIAAFILCNKLDNPEMGIKEPLQHLVLFETWLKENNKTIANATPQAIQQFLDEIQNHQSLDYATQVRHTLNSCYALLTKQEFIKVNPLVDEPVNETVQPLPHPKKLSWQWLALIGLLLLLAGSWATMTLLPPSPVTPAVKGLTTEETPPPPKETLQEIEAKRLQFEIDRWAQEVVIRAQYIHQTDLAILRMRKEQQQKQLQAKEPIKPKPTTPTPPPPPQTHCIQGDCRNGTGTFRFDNGNEYTGEWRNSARHGSGTYTYTNGEKYIGSWKNDQMEGQGVFHYQNGTRYEGEWLNNQKHGHGTLFQPNGDMYVGNWRNDKKFGQGTKHLLFTEFLAKQLQTRDIESKRLETDQQQTLLDQQKQSAINQSLEQGNTGCLLGDCQNGKGVYVFKNGDYYNGEWLNGDKHGLGTYVFKSGDRYSGNWHANQKHGQGSYLFKSGQRYDGGWHLNKKHGQGIVTFPNGLRITGQWEHGEQLR